MQSKTQAHILTYGFDQDATIRVSDVEHVSSEEGKPLGTTFKLNYHDTFVPIRIEGSLGKSQAWSAAAAATVGSALGLNLVQVSEALRNYHGPKGRLKIISGIHNSNIIDDTYNASPASTRLALETLRDVPAIRKIAVLGDMLELGEHSEKVHHDIQQFASQIADIVVYVGPRMKPTTEQLHRPCLCFATSDEAKFKVKELIHEHDLILVKGSQGMRMERIIEIIMAEPKKAQELLVRQSQRWLSK
jgi:UDP-N-acetylmuramoyl-tripeptide--D-alanyl-D-alanine ligase